MTNEELKKKIVDVLRGNIEYELHYFPDDNYTEVEFDYEKIADALIGNGYGNVAEWKRRAEVAEKEREEYRKSTRIALRALEIIKRNIIRYCAADFPNILQQAKREIEEE